MIRQELQRGGFEFISRLANLENEMRGDFPATSLFLQGYRLGDVFTYRYNDKEIGIIASTAHEESTIIWGLYVTPSVRWDVCQLPLLNPAFLLLKHVFTKDKPEYAVLLDPFFRFDSFARRHNLRCFDDFYIGCEGEGEFETTAYLFDHENICDVVKVGTWQEKKLQGK